MRPTLSVVQLPAVAEALPGLASEAIHFAPTFAALAIAR